jgi:hypothetical protein
MSQASQLSFISSSTGQIVIAVTTASTSPTTGALIVGGGAGFGGDLYACNIYSNNFQVLTSATIGTYGVSTITAGTDTAVSASTGVVVVWNTSTLQSITNRGAATTNPVTISNATVSTSTNTGALQVVGGVGVQGNIYAGAIYDQNARVWTTATLTNNNQLTNGAGYLTSATIGQYGVSAITAGTDTAISTATGSVTIWDISTLQSVTGRGASTTNQVTLNNGLVLGNTAQNPILMNGSYSQPTPGFIVANGTLVGTTASTAIYAFNYQHNLAPVSTATISNYYGQLFLPTLQNTATYNGMYGSFARIDMGATATTGTVGTWIGFTSEAPNRNAASDVRFTNHYGFRAQDPNSITATNVIGFTSQISSAGGGSRYNIYASGSAQNRFTGGVGIGKDPTVALDVVGQVLVSNTLTISSTALTTSTTTGALTVAGGVGVGGSVYVGNRVGFVNASNVSAVYQYYNAATNSLDTIFG